MIRRFAAWAECDGCLVGALTAGSAEAPCTNVAPQWAESG